MIQFNTKYWPVVYFFIDNEKMNEETFEEYKKNYLTLLLKCKKEKQKMILISDLNNQNNLPLKYIMKQAYFNHKIHKFNEDYVSLVCVYLNNDGFTKILDMYFSICKPCCPYKVCRTYDIVNEFIKEKTDIVFDTHVFKPLEAYTKNIHVEEHYKKIKKDLKDVSLNK